jgi:type IV secretion system protein VirB9
MRPLRQQRTARASRNVVAGVCVICCALFFSSPARPAEGAAAATGDGRIRVLAYAADAVYRLKGFVGYQIDLEFEPGEAFVGLGSGDLGSLTFAAQENHLFVKPRAAGVDTNLTVLTSRRAYHFDYTATARRPDPAFGDVIYVLRFTYSPQSADRAADQVEHRLANAADARSHNLNYGYCGNPQLKPQSAWDDGVQTRLRFGPQQELPAVFVRNDDGTESLVNFSVESGELIVHRVSRRFIVRRGRLEGCIVNEAFTGGGERLESGTVAPAVERVTKEVRP